MTEAFTAVGGLVAGLLLGAFFFGGLWWTVRRGLVRPNPALWFAASLLLRTAVLAAIMYWMARQDWRLLLAGGAGVLLARPVVQRLAGLHDRRSSEMRP